MARCPPCAAVWSSVQPYGSERASTPPGWRSNRVASPAASPARTAANRSSTEMPSSGDIRRSSRLLLLSDEPPELRLVEQRDLVAFLAQALDLHQLESGVLACRLQGVGPPAHHHRGLAR